MRLDALLSPQRAYVAVGPHVYEVHPATSEDLLRAGLAHLAGLATITRLREEAELETERAQVSGLPGATPEAIEAAVAMRREAIAASRQSSLKAALAEDPEVQDRTVRALLVAGVRAMGVLERPVPAIGDLLHAGVERYGPEWAVADHVRVIEGLRMHPVQLVPADMIPRDAEVTPGEVAPWPIEQIPHHAQQVIAATAYELAEGGAASVAPFRVDAWVGRGGRQNRQEVSRAAE